MIIIIKIIIVVIIMIIIIIVIIIISLFQQGDFLAGSTAENIPWWLLLPCTSNHLQHTK